MKTLKSLILIMLLPLIGLSYPSPELDNLVMDTSISSAVCEGELTYEVFHDYGDVGERKCTLFIWYCDGVYYGYNYSCWESDDPECPKCPNPH